MMLMRPSASPVGPLPTGRAKLCWLAVPQLDIYGRNAERDLTLHRHFGFVAVDALHVRRGVLLNELNGSVTPSHQKQQREIEIVSQTPQFTKTEPKRS
jgi:hypothetical protein